MRLISIGKSSSCNIRISNEYVSSYHAELILLDNGDIFLVDCGSTNGTFLQGKRIQPNVEVPVRRGDKIEFDQVPLNWGDVPTIPLPDPSKVKGIYGIGKSQRNRYCLPGESVSRYHATFKEMKNGKWFIQDHSRNGTYINGQRIPANQDYPIKKGDMIVCGSVSCPNPIKGGASVPGWVWGAVAGLAAVVLLVFGLSKANRGGGGGIGVSKMDPNKATVLVVEHHILKINFADNPFKAATGNDLYLGDVTTWSDGTVSYNITTDVSSAHQEWSTGTGFFISDKGHILTNKHITNAVWADKHYSEASNMQYWLNIVEKMREDIAVWVKKRLPMNASDAEAAAMRMYRSAVELEAVPMGFYIGYSGRNYNLANFDLAIVTELEKAYLVREATNDEVDMALLQLNNPVTPAFADYFRTKDAITDFNKLSQKEQYYTIGYPAGVGESFIATNNQMQASSGLLHLVQNPGEYQLVFGGDKSIGGKSGSPIFDEKNRLVGILWGSRTRTENTMATPIKHAKALYPEF